MALLNRDNPTIERQKLVLYSSITIELHFHKISQEFDLLSNFGSLFKIRNAHFGHCSPLGVKGIVPLYKTTIGGSLAPPPISAHSKSSHAKHVS